MPKSRRIEDATLPEFRFNRRRKHPSTVIKRRGEIYESLLITHASDTSGKPNARLYKNPDPHDQSKAYLVKKVYKDKAKSFDKRPIKGWAFDPSDKKTVKRIKKKRNKKS